MMMTMMMMNFIKVSITFTWPGKAYYLRTPESEEWLILLSPLIVELIELNQIYRTQPSTIQVKLF